MIRALTIAFCLWLLCASSHAQTIINSVQQGSITGNGTATISSVNTAKATVTYAGVDNFGSATINTFQCALVLTNATTVTANCGNSIQAVNFTVVEFK